MNNQRRTREEVLNVFQACQAKVGKPPGREVFLKLSGLKATEIDYYWPRYSELLKEAGAQPNEFQLKLPDEDVFQDYAKVCLHLRKLPTHKELRIAKENSKRERIAFTSDLAVLKSSVQDFVVGYRSRLQK